MNSLLDMFPTYAREVAEEAIRDTQTFDKAIDYMITFSRTGQSKNSSSSPYMLRNAEMNPS